MARPGTVQMWIEYLAARSILAAIAVLPPWLAMTTGRSLGMVAHRLAGDLRRTGERNLQIAFPERSDEERRKILAACFAGLGRQLGLFAQFNSTHRDNLLKLIEWRGFENLDAAKSTGRPIILFTGHLGAWEMSSFGLSLRGDPLNFLVRRLDNPKLEEFVERSRTRFGNQSVDKKGAARSMLRTLDSGGTLGILVDLNTLDEEAIFVDFFGIPASTTFLVAKLALKKNAVLLPIFVPWDAEREKYVVEILPEVLIEKTGNEENDVRKLTQRITKIVEEFIREHPEQWLWIHKRWKTRPKGEPGIY